MSVLMPFRDAAATLGEALDSIQAQTLGSFELMAVDDGSVDHSAHIAMMRAQEDPRIRLIRAGRVGIVRAMNLGIQEARASLIARMDADDIMHPERLELQWKFMQEHPDVTLVASQAEMFPKESIRAGYREYLRWQNGCLEPWQIEANIYVETPFVHPTVMVRKRALEELGGYREGDFPEDYELWLRMFQAGMSMAKIPRALLRWRDHPGRLSRVDTRCSREAFDRLRASFLAKDPRLEGGREVVIWGAGRRSRQRARLIMEKGIRPVAWIDIDPDKIGKEVCGLRVHPPKWLNRDPKPMVLVYVRTHGAREQIRENLMNMGYEEGEDFLAVG